MPAIRRLIVAGASLALIVALTAPIVVATDASDRLVLERAVATGRLDAAVPAELERAGRVDALVTFRDPAARMEARTGARRIQAAPAVRLTTGSRLRAIAAADAATAAAGRGIETLHAYESFAVRLVRIGSVAALARLLERPAVVRVRADVMRRPLLAQSLPLIKQPTAAANGWTGSGTAVAVIDSGVDWKQDAFKPGSGGCTAVATPADCRVVYARDFAPSDGVRDDTSRHGTNVAGIVLGVARDTRILALDVFSGDAAADSWVLAAVDWTVANRATYKTRAINLSLGSDERRGVCDGLYPDYAEAFASVRDAGMLPVVAAGNTAVVGGSYVDGVSAPGCIAEAVTVGAVYDGGAAPTDWGDCVDPSATADRIACWSQSSVGLDLLAPGVVIDAAGETQAGTSQATPHVAGAIAALWDARPSTSPGRVEAALEATGKAIKDGRNGRTYRRIDVAAAGAELLDGPTWSSPTAVGAAKTSNTGMALARTVSGTTAILHAVGVADVVGGVPVADGGPFQGVTYLRKAGTAAWTSRRLNPTTKHGSRVAIAAAGARVHVAWVQTASVDGAADPLAPTVLYARSSADYGATWSPAIRLTSTSGRVDYPTVAAAGARVHVAWTDAVTGAIRVATSTNGGATFPTRKQVGTADLTDDSGRYAYPSVAATGSTVGVAWVASAATGWRVRARISLDAGVNWGSTTLSIAASGAYSVHAAAVNGRVGIAWDGGTAVRYREWFAGALGTTRTVAPIAAPWVIWPMVALHGTGRVGVAWSGCVDLACGRADVRWSESSTNGTSWSPPRIALDAASSALRRASYYPSIVWATSTSRQILVNAYGTSGDLPTYRMYLVTGTGSP